MGICLDTVCLQSSLYPATEINPRGLLFDEKMDWAWVNMLGGIFLQMRLEDWAYRHRRLRHCDIYVEVPKL